MGCRSVGQAVAALSWALALLFQSMCLAEPAGTHAEQVADCLTKARAELTAAQRHLDRLGEQMTAAPDALYEVVTAAENCDARRRKRARRLGPARRAGLCGW